MNCTCSAYKFPHRPGSGVCNIPECDDCEFVNIVHDPFATGDHLYYELECTLHKCPWNKFGGNNG